MHKRIYLETLDRNNVKTIEALVKRHCNTECEGTRMLSVYEFSETPEVVIESFINTVLKDELVHNLLDTVDYGDVYLSYEAVDGQYDQTTEWANALLKEGYVKVSTLIIFNQTVDLDKVRRLLVNPLEFQDKDPEVFSTVKVGKKKPMATYPTFINDDKEAMHEFYLEHGFAMEFEDLLYIQDYFKSEKRNPTETELLVLDTYWSDHCRHTTFMTEIEDVQFEDFALKEAVEASFKHYLKDKEELGRKAKVTSLMDITAQNGRYAKVIWNDDVIEVSDEVNACSIRINVDVDGVDEPWLLMFKNETHNHPTEIEPYGGASTCIGGAIRDPLSGRAFVYQAMRITGSGNVLETLDETLDDKLPQAFISQHAAAGYSHYADQIGMSSSYVKEIYHDSYKAKRMELGAVVGAIKESDLIRKAPEAGDIVVMLGGRTGRDGVGGATGSSDVQTEGSAETNAAEVQKGNALEERKIMRLFRDPKISSIIKKSNDFGAGGVSVAIGELADGLEIDLDQVKLKYDDLNPTEIAISESQERMAVVLDPKDVDTFMKASLEENIEASIVATVNDSHRLVIKDANGTYVDLDRTFVDSGGIRQKTKAVITDTQISNPLTKTHGLDKASILKELSLLKNASQAGLAQQFNAHQALIKPLLGKTYLSPNIGSVESIPLLKGTTQTVSMLTHGFIPEVSEYSPYVGGSLAVVESLSKTVAMGGDYTKVYLSFQEYFNRLTTPEKWGRVMQALLGTYEAQKAFKLAAIGGKDSMSGSYGDLDVVDTLVSFACSPQRKEYLVSSELKAAGSKLYLLEVPMNDLGIVDYDELINQYHAYHQLVLDHKVLSASTSDDTSVLMTLIKMAVGNQIGVDLNVDATITQLKPGSIVFETEMGVEGFTLLGHTTTEQNFVVNEEIISMNELIETFTNTLKPVYPFILNENVHPKEVHVSPSDGSVAKGAKVLIPVFPGMNGEYAVEAAFNNEGADVEVFVYQDDVEAFAQAIKRHDVVVFADGAMNGDVPTIAAYGLQVLRSPLITQAIEDHVAKGKKVLGFGNGFQLLVKSGLLPFEKVQETTLSFSLNDSGLRTSIDVDVVASSDSLWTKEITSTRVYHSKTHGKLVGDVLDKHIAFQYANVNPSGSVKDVEAMVSENGTIFGRMSEVTSDIVRNALRGVRHE